MVPLSGTGQFPQESRERAAATADIAPDRGLVDDATEAIDEAIDAIEAVEAREVMELAVVRLAAVRRSEGDLERLCAFVEGMRECRDTPEAFAEFDFAFHATLAAAARNRLLASSLSALHEGMREMITRFAVAAVAEARMNDLFDSHLRLLEAVRRRDPDEAALIVSDMMVLLRIELGRCLPRTTRHVIARQVPQTGMLQDRPHKQGDRP